MYLKSWKNTGQKLNISDYHSEKDNS